MRRVRRQRGRRERGNCKREGGSKHRSDLRNWSHLDPLSIVYSLHDTQGATHVPRGGEPGYFEAR